MAAKSKKLLKVIDGIRSWNMSTSQPPTSKVCVEIDECLKSEDFQVGKIAIHGFPHQPMCMAFDPMQKIVAIGTKTGVIRIFGRPGVDYVVSHPSSSAVIQILFLINEGGLISICQDDVVHLWNIRQKQPELVHSLQFKREHLTCGHVPVSSSWLYLGTDKGNVHFVNIQRFVTSGYVINWNKAIDLSQSAHPGRVVQIAENPQDSNKLMLGYSSGILTLWDLRTKAAEARFKYSDSLYGFSWHWDGKSFLTCHNHGILATWSCKQPQRPVSLSCPHAGGESLPDDYVCYEPIYHVEWLPNKNGEPLIVFAGGARVSGAGACPAAPSLSASSSRPEALSSTGFATPPDSSIEAVESRDNTASGPVMAGARAVYPSLSVKRGKRLVVMQMDYRLIQFTSLCASPFVSESMDPYAVAVLLQHDLVVVDLLSPNLAIFENPYPMDLHSSPVTACLYLVDCPGDLVPAFYSVGSRGQRCRTNPNANASESETFSSREWPITGGEWGLSYNAYPELVLTGHADGSVRFWDASEVTLTPLYKVRTLRFFKSCLNNTTSGQKDSSGSRPGDGQGSPRLGNVNDHYCSVLLDTEEDPFAVRSIQFCPDSRLLLTASSTHICLLHFCRREQSYEIPVMDINMAYDSLDDLVLGCTAAGDAFADDQPGSGPSGTMTKETVFSSAVSRNTHSMRPSGSVSSAQSVYVVDRDLRVFVPVRTGHLSWSAGYQPVLVCRLGIPALGFDCVAGSGSVNDPTLVPPPPICAISLNSHYSLLAVGNEYGIAVLDYINRTCLLSTAISDLCGPTDVLPRPASNRSPGRAQTSSSGLPSAPDQSSGNSVVSTVGGVARTQSPTGHSGCGPLRGPALSMDPAQSAESSTTGRYGVVSRAAAFRGELKRAKSQVVLAYRTSTALRQQTGHESTHTQQSVCSSGGASGEKGIDMGPSSHSCSLSTSTSSLEQVSGEGVRTVVFMDSFARKTDPTPCPCLYIGTTRGNVLAIYLNLSDIRTGQGPSSIVPSGSIFRVSGEVVYVGFLDLCGEPFPIASDKWDESLFVARTPGPLVKQASVTSSAVSSTFENGSASSLRQGDNSVAARRLGTGTHSGKERKPGPGATRNSSSSTSSSSGPSGLNTSGGVYSGSGNSGVADSPSTGAAGLTETDKQLMVICSEKQARVIALPSQTCLYKVKITETSTVHRAAIQRLRSPGAVTASNAETTGTTAFLGCYLANGHFVALSLPSLRLLMDVDYLPLTECVTRSFSFGQHGQAVYLTSPSELVKITWSADVCSNLRDMQGELFLPCNMPEPPKKNFFKNLLSGTLPSSVDRDELFGETASGKSTSGISTLLPSTRVDKLNAQASAGTSEIARARNAAIERGERLGQLDLQTQEMMDQAKGFGRSAAMLAAKYEKKDKRWGWPL